MDFAYDIQTEEFRKRLLDFMDEYVYPAEPVFAEQVARNAREGHPWSRPPVVAELKEQARSRGLWNLFLAHNESGAGLTNLQYAPLAEITGRSPWLAPEALNCAAPDTGNMELLAEFGTEQQRDRWLRPLLDGEIRSAFCMTEPDVASSDASNIATRIERDGDEYVINGRKWWSSGAMNPGCEILIVMGKTARGGDRHRQQSMILVPTGTPGVDVQRGITLFGYDDAPHGGHAEVEFRDVRVPAANLIAGEGDGFTIAQARLLVLKTAWMMDTVGNKGAHTEIQAIKIGTPAMAEWVIDKAIQAHGAAGVSQDFPLAALWANARSLRFADGPDEVHKRSLARRELRPYQQESRPRQG